MTHKIKNTISIITRIATILLFVSALFLSCQKNNDNEPEDEPSTINKQDLIGTWAFQVDWNPLTGEDRIGYAGYVYKDCLKKQRLIFSENEVIEYYYWFDRKETECKEEVWKMSYRLSGDRIIFKHQNGNTFSQKIQFLGSQLIFTYFDDILSKKMVTKAYMKL
ncbi:lipocalin family protein [Capnocytophaga leadbetteri]|uniref:lipocalin family protein n=2 Tax=Capnocytophaga leadbetteri TaxID=327575 RepID=UPI0028E61041|nr:lipocalin family protein [Capnocytophaga leadbetteri]